MEPASEGQCHRGKHTPVGASNERSCDPISDGIQSLSFKDLGDRSISFASFTLE